MGRLSSIGRLPAADREWLDQQLLENGFTDYQGLADALRVKHPKISKSAIHRYGMAKEKRLMVARAAAELQSAGIDRDLALALTGEITEVIVLDRVNNHGRIVPVRAPAAAVIAALKQVNKGSL